MSKFQDYNFSGKKALVRVDFNVPLNENFEITDDTRIRRSLPTLKKILADGGSVIILSHLGRPKNGPEDKFSLKHLQQHLAELLSVKVHFASDCIGEVARRAASDLQAGELLLLENTRFHAGETKGDESLAKQMAELGDVYVNDAFGTAHRAHASTAIIAHSFGPENRMFGLLMQAELENANKVMREAEKPFTAILGGAKVSDKILIIENLLDRADGIIIGGGMAYTFFKAMNGQVGNSLVEEDKIDLALELVEKAQMKGVELMLPEDSVVAINFSNEADSKISSNIEIPDGWMGLDIGPKAIEAFTTAIKDSRTILWNGPMGVFEMSNFQAGTKAVADAIAEATKNGAFSLIGGGDSVAAINKFGYQDKVSYVSTGGGAMLEFFEGKTLPGVAAIEN
jgi:phosphoglycerate kinase